MIVIRKTAAGRLKSDVPKSIGATARSQELLCLLLSSTVVLVGMWLVYQAKRERPTPFDKVEEMIAGKQLLNLSEVPSREALLPFLAQIENSADRQFAAEKIYAYLKSGAGPLPNVGALSRLRADASEIEAKPQLRMYRDALDALRRRESETGGTGRPPSRGPRVSVLPQFGDIKPGFIVRTPSEFRRTLLTWLTLYVLAFYVVHFIWRWWLRFDGDQLLLPLAHLLSGVGLILMVSLRDPLRDTLSFENSAQGAVIGCFALLVASKLDFERHFASSRYMPLALGLLLSVALILFGSGPGGSDAKVNLLNFQPVEVIKLLVVLFLAGYFAREWEALRELREKPRFFASLAGRLNVPRLEYVFPVVVGMTLVMVFFFLQKDLGPALVLSCLFLALYGVARRRFVMVAFGLALMLAGFYLSYRFALSNTVADRIHIWLSPWDNGVRGGDQLVHGFWALAAGGFSGTGLGLGDPSFVPAIHTDFIMAALGEELGFVGLLFMFAVYTLVVCKGVAISLRAPSNYSFFLALGLTLLTALQILLISLGVFGLIPLSGVVSPLLSFGRTAMITNFAVLGALLSISAQPRDVEWPEFRKPVLLVGAAMCVLMLAVVTKAAYIQVVRADEVLAASVLAPQGDDSYAYGQNPRFRQIRGMMPRGSIYDRNGIPLATSRWEEVVQHRQDYERLLGGKLEDRMRPGQGRYYPFGAKIFHLLGDARTRVQWTAPNTAYIERDSKARLQGFDDYEKDVKVKDPKTGEELTDPMTGKPVYAKWYNYKELIPLLSYRYRPEHESVRHLLERERDVHTSIDIRLQLRVADILRDRLRAAREDKGAIVVLDAETGDLLASVSYPLPEDADLARSSPEGADKTSRLLDRARFGLYPPGSTFKLVTATAALSRNSGLATQTFECVRLSDGRAGNTVRGKVVRDDVKDQPHNVVDMRKGITVSCNAYFAQLGMEGVGADALARTADIFGISVDNPNTPATLRDLLPQASYGQGETVASPFQMARVAATIADGGKMPFGRWVTDDSNQRTQPPQSVLKSGDAALIAEAMRAVVTQGTAARQLSRVSPPVAGKTGTAEVGNGDSHSWFVGFAPYGNGAAAGRRIAFSIVIEHGGYGGTAAAPAAADLVAAARELGIIR